MKKADTLYQLGLDYYQGKGLPQDTDMAIDYLLKASKLNHLEAKILGADLLFKQAKNDRSIYYEDGYRLGTELMVEVYRAGKLDVTLPFLLNNKLFNEMCTLEELEDYYQEAYRLGFRETKFELAKLLFAKESYHSAEHLFIESLKEDISKESHLFLYQIYRTKECYNEKKALVQFKEAMKYGFVALDYEEFIENDFHVLVKNTAFESNFSEDKIITLIVSIIKSCYYADQSFKKWFSANKVTVRIYFDLVVKVLNASYDIMPTDQQIDDFVYEPMELGKAYFMDEENKKVTESDVVLATGKDSGFYQSQEREFYLELDLKDVFDRFNIKDKTPILNTQFNDQALDQIIRTEIKKDIKNKHRDKSKHQIIKVKKFNIYKTLVPSFDYIFIYNHKEYVSQKYLFDDKNWKVVFNKEIKDIDYKTMKLNLEFPLGEGVYQEIDQIKQEVPKYKKKAIFLHLVKSLISLSLLWSIIIFIENSFFMKHFNTDTYDITLHLSQRPLWFAFGLLIFGLGYYLFRIKIYAPIINNIRDKIIDNPAYVLPENTNKDHFKMQALEVLLLVIFTVIFFLFSNFIPMI